MHRNRTTTGLLLAGLLGLLLSGLGAFATPWPWVVVLSLGAVRLPLLTVLRDNRAREEEATQGLRHAREANMLATLNLQGLIGRWEERLTGTLTPEESRQLRADFNAMVGRMAELEAQVAEVAKEQRARALVAPFSEVE